MARVAFESFVRESKQHGWPSFRDEEVNWDLVRCLPNGECVSVDGTHRAQPPRPQRQQLLHQLVSVAGNPTEASKTCNVEELAATTTQRNGVARVVAPRAGSAHQHSPLALGRWAPGGRKISPVESHSLLRGDDVLFPLSILERIRVTESLVRLGTCPFLFRNYPCLDEPETSVKRLVITDDEELDVPRRCIPLHRKRPPSHAVHLCSATTRKARIALVGAGGWRRAGTCPTFMQEGHDCCDRGSIGKSSRRSFRWSPWRNSRKYGDVPLYESIDKLLNDSTMASSLGGVLSATCMQRIATWA